MKNVFYRWLTTASLLGCSLSLAATSSAKLDVHGAARAPDSLAALIPAPTESREHSIAAETGQTPTSSLHSNGMSLWNIDGQLLALGGKAGENVGTEVAIDGDTILVSAKYTDSPNANDVGAVYVFVRSGNTWVQQAKLQGSDSSYQDNFGAKVAIVGDTAVIGAPNDDDLGMGSGSVYVFTRNGQDWTEQVKLLPSVGGNDQYFGNALVFDGNTIIVGAPGYSGGVAAKTGAVFVFERDANTWIETNMLMATDPREGDGFGTALSLSGDQLFVGAPGTDDGGIVDAGAAYIFERNGSTWLEQSSIYSPFMAANGYFGRALASGGTNALIATGQPFGGLPNSDLVIAYEYDGGAWIFRETLTTQDNAPNDYFGSAVALRGELALIAAPSAQIGDKKAAGATYVFARQKGSWVLLEKLVPPAAEENALFSTSMAISNDWLVVGRPGNDGAFFPGAAYVFLPQFVAKGNACTASAECANGFSCIDGVCCDSICGFGAPDDCLSCSIATGGTVDGECGVTLAGTICRIAGWVCDAKEICDGISSACPPDAAIDGCMDSDFDGLSDETELLFGTNPGIFDSDGDGVPDGLEPEWNVDTDKDGLINALDNDSDNDGLDDSLESNPQGTNPLDADSDDDCVADGTEDLDHDTDFDPGETNPLVRDYQGFCCQNDTDCGTETSGQICIQAPRCQAGCRGLHGNGCPSGTICTSIDETPGACVIIGTGNGGNGGAGGSGGAGGNDVTITPEACACRMASQDETNRGLFMLAACVACVFRRKNRRIRALASMSRCD